MSRLLIYRENGDILLDTEDAVRISNELALIDIGFRRWPAHGNLGADASPDEVLAAYADDVSYVQNHYAFRSVDVISMNSTVTANMGAEKLNAARSKFLSEHIHADDEVRFFIEGEGLFCIHINGKVYQILCTRADFISVPANTKHWFDMGSRPDFKCIRFFSDEAGWLASYSGDNIAERFPLLDDLVAVAA
jgi:1,2-dihydroxy-3-keto-5-methylthiopentene dioxygenase